MKPNALFGRIFLSFLLFGVSPAFSENVECTAKVTNRLFQVSLNKTTRELRVLSDNGYRYEGIASFYFSPRYGNETFFLSTGFGTGIEVELESSGQKRIAFCIKSTECYLCRR